MSLCYFATAFLSFSPFCPQPSQLSLSCSARTMALTPAAMDGAGSSASETLVKLAALLQERAEIFAAPSTSRETAEHINRTALQATKRLFDECEAATIVFC